MKSAVHISFSEFFSGVLSTFLVAIFLSVRLCLLKYFVVALVHMMSTEWHCAFLFDKPL